MLTGFFTRCSLPWTGPAPSFLLWRLVSDFAHGFGGRRVADTTHNLKSLRILLTFWVACFISHGTRPVSQAAGEFLTWRF
jgi:hypothetical protein